MVYLACLLGGITIGLLGGLLVVRKRLPEKNPAAVDYEEIYKEIKNDILDDVSRRNTIEKLKKRLLS